MDRNPAAAEQSGGVIRQGTHAEPGRPTEDSIERTNDTAREPGGEPIAWNGELRDDPLGSRKCMRKDGIEQLLQLVGEKTVEEEVRNDQVVGSRRIPVQCIGVMQVNALADLGPAQATDEKSEHGMAGVDHIRSESGISGQ